MKEESGEFQHGGGESGEGEEGEEEAEAEVLCVACGVWRVA